MELLKFLYITIGKEVVCGRNFFKNNFTVHDSKINEICRISLCDLVSSKETFTEFYFFDWLPHLLDFYYGLTSDSFSKQLIFAKKASTHFLKLLRRIFNYFSKIKFSEFHKKAILPVFVLFVLKQVFSVPRKTTFRL